MSKNESKQLYVGWARTDITPDKPVQLWGQFHERISTGVHDPLTATVLVLETRDAQGAGEQAVIISCDLVSPTNEVHQRLREALASSLPDLDATKVFIAATHTHTAPTLTDGGWYPLPGPGVMKGSEYAAFLVERLHAIVVQAWNTRQPGNVSWVLGRAAVGYCRRALYADGRALMYGRSDRPDFMGVEGGEDHGLDMLYFWDGAGKLVGLLINVACPSQVVEGKNFISSDYWSEVRKELAQRYSPDLFLLPLCAAAGDQSPRDLVRRGRGEADYRDVSGLVEIGRRIANAVDEMFPAAQKDIRSSLPFAHIVQDIALPALAITPEQAEAARLERDEWLKREPSVPGSGVSSHVYYYQQVLDRYAKQVPGAEFHMELHVLRLGEVALCTNPFELYLDFGLRMKARSKAVQTLVVQLSAPADGCCYLPTQRAVAGGHYGAQASDNLVGPEGGQVLVERTLETINALWE